MQIIKNGVVEQADWRHIADDESLPLSKFTISLQRWLSERATLQNCDGEMGIRLQGDSDLKVIKEDLARFAVIVLEFPAMADGRGFSLARLLRGRYGYTGDLWARGDYIRDQMFFLQRVGVNAFECTEGQKPLDLLPAFSEFSVTYQVSSDASEPLFRREQRDR